MTKGSPDGGDASGGSSSALGGGGVMEKVLFVEVGFGNDQHGQDPTKACVRCLLLRQHNLTTVLFGPSVCEASLIQLQIL